MPRHFVHVPAVLWVAAISSPAIASSFFGLEIPAGYNSRAAALSPNGSVVMGEIWAPGMPSETFHWTAAAGLTRQADIPGWGEYAWPQAMSYDGGVVVAYDRHQAVGSGHAFRWNSDNGRVYLGDPTEVYHSDALGLSWDGTTAVGYRFPAGNTRPEAVIWQNGQAQPLGQLSDVQEASLLTDISATGATIVGQIGTSPGTTEPFRWTAAEGVEIIELPDTTYFDTGPLVSADGSTIVGNWLSPSGDQGFVWTQQHGAVGLGDLPGGVFKSWIADISFDGQIIIGSSVTGSYSPGGGLILDSTTAFIWDEDHGMRNLPDILANQYGLDLQGWELWEATEVSADGRTIVGNGISPDGYWRTWIAQIPEPSSGAYLLLWIVLDAPGRRNRDAAKRVV